MHPGVHHSGGGGGGGGSGGRGTRRDRFFRRFKIPNTKFSRFAPRAVFPQRCLSRENSPRASDARSFLPRPDRRTAAGVVGIGIGIGSRRRYLFIRGSLALVYPTAAVGN